MDDELERLEKEIGECGRDFIGWMRKAADLGYAATFVPVEYQGEQTLCLAAWKAVTFGESERPDVRILAAKLYCEWTRTEAIGLGATLP